MPTCFIWSFLNARLAQLTSAPHRFSDLWIDFLQDLNLLCDKLSEPHVATVHCEIMFAHVTPCDAALQWLHYSKLIASSGWVGPPCPRKSKRRGARGVSTSWNGLHVCVHFTSAWDKQVIIFFFFFFLFTLLPVMYWIQDECLPWQTQ